MNTCAECGGPLTEEASDDDASITNESRRAHVFDTIDDMLRHTPQSTATLERITAFLEMTCRAERNASALDDIAHMLCDPEWGAGMLEDIGAIVTQTGRSINNLPGDEPTWDRH